MFTFVMANVRDKQVCTLSYGRVRTKTSRHPTVEEYNPMKTKLFQTVILPVLVGVFLISVTPSGKILSLYNYNQ